MHYLIYVSSTSHLYSDQDLENILTVSRSNNSRLGVTGLLLYHDGMVLQMLEGEKACIHMLYQKIMLDKRHTGVMKMTEGVEEARIFGDWTMGFRRLSDKDWSAFAEGLSLDPKTLLNATTVLHPEMWTLFRTFIKVNERSL